MTCRDFIAFLDDYLAGELPTETRVVFDGHLQCCADCRNYLDSYEKTVRLGKQAFASLDEDVAPGSVPEPLIRAILSATSRVRHSD